MACFLGSMGNLGSGYYELMGRVIGQDRYRIWLRPISKDELRWPRMR